MPMQKAYLSLQIHFASALYRHGRRGKKWQCKHYLCLHMRHRKPFCDGIRWRKKPVAKSPGYCHTLMRRLICQRKYLRICDGRIANAKGIWYGSFYDSKCAVVKKGFSKKKIIFEILNKKKLISPFLPLYYISCAKKHPHICIYSQILNLKRTNISI